MAQTQLYTKRAQVFVVEESAQDTYETQTAGDGFLAEIPDVPLNILDGENFIPATVRGDGLSPDEIPGKAAVQIPFRVPLKGSGTAGTAPEFSEALKACGMEAVNVVSTSDTYHPLLTFDGDVNPGNPGPSYSVTILEDGVAYKAKGAFGNVVFTGVVGEPIFAEFTFTGAYVAPGDDALETVTYQTTNAPAFMGASFAMNFGGAVTPKGVENFVLDLGNQVVPMADVNATDGYYGARIVSRKSFGSFDPEMVLTATANSNFYSIWRAGTAGTLTTGAVGSTSGNIVTISVNRCQYRPISQRNKEGIRALEIPFGVTSQDTDTEGTNLDITIAFT